MATPGLATDRISPSTASYILATAILAGVTGYFIGQGSSLGLFSSAPAQQRRSKQGVKDDDDESDFEDDEDEYDAGELATFEGNRDEVKLVLVVRTDLGMGKGKIAAQCSHATLACYKYYVAKSADSPILKRWERGGQAKVALQVKTEEDMLLLQAQAISLGLCARVIHDAGRTQIASGSRTVLGILGPKSIVDQVTGHLKLFQDPAAYVPAITMADAISIEQNNKIRVALEPGPVFKESKESSTLESREAQGFQNWQKLQDDAETKRKREEKNAAIKRARDLARRDAVLQGKGLGETDVGDLDTMAWLSQHKKLSKKIEKERARKLAEELAERERAVEYTATDLAGVKVAHELGDFDGTEDHVLTLKDATIDEYEEEGDELENLDLVDKDKLKERLELKKKRTAYDPVEADGTGNILAQYDEEIDGKKRKHFTLDAKGSTVEEREAKRQHVSDMLKKQAINLDIVADTPTSDYMDISEVKVKKPKKKKTKTRQKALDEDDIFPLPDATTGSNEDQMQTEAQNAGGGINNTKLKKTHDTSFVDDEDLQASLAMQRRAAFKKRKKLRPEDLARQLKEEDSQTPMETDNGDGAEEGPGLVIDETSEFVSNLQRPVLSERPERRPAAPAEDDEAKEESPDINPEDVDMEGVENAVHTEEGADVGSTEDTQKTKMSATGLEEESTLDEGLGATLSMLRQRGLVQESEAADLNSLHRDRQKFLQEKYRRESEAEKRARLQRERDRTTGKLERMSAREREEYAQYENKQRDQQESRHMADVFNREYKPDVQLKYVDEHGRLMNQKEAFKHLSHQFHGKGSGKMKTEKHLKKIEEEKKREAMGALESSQHTGMNSAMGATAKKNRQAGVRLA
ncbi:SART-1 family-domain-containing protein [Talaromyces proteolyticus]|uniref:peptidyl-tRNA hydrolase n=1 Tax=Talaromyces proteolyticus TaxID=1131652 RepID=A0AAD4KRM2_9EURO|nr:SART-1 family-domain-containing protein [Talaromyces proteolyticus]KAH8697714.1 SART-1 family-domain-containing protein [Talaromyces proteolyticus]